MATTGKEPKKELAKLAPATGKRSKVATEDNVVYFCSGYAFHVKLCY